MPLENIQTIFDKKLEDSQYNEAYLKEKSILASAVAITKAREAAGLTQRELAERSGIPQSTIARIERGYNTSIDTLSKIAFALNKRVKISFI